MSGVHILFALTDAVRFVISGTLPLFFGPSLTCGIFILSAAHRLWLCYYICFFSLEFLASCAAIRDPATFNALFVILVLDIFGLGFLAVDHRLPLERDCLIRLLK